MGTSLERRELLRKVLAVLGVSAVEALGVGATASLAGCQRATAVTMQPAPPGATTPVGASAPGVRTAPAPAPAGEWLGLGDRAGGTTPGGPSCYGACPHQVCVHEPAARPGFAAPPPHDGCAAALTSTTYSRTMVFDAYGTTAERLRYEGACCYSWREPHGRGRPLRADDGVRVAGATPSAEWLGAVPRTVRLPDSPALRAAIGAHYREMAAAEHSSVASFARLALELMAAGAPPDLLASALQSGREEIAHARLAYALAAHFDGGALGPGPLDLRGAEPRGDLRAVALECLADGCVGEAVGALLLRRAAVRVEDRWMSFALVSMAEEEESHALLAFAVVRFALETGDAALRAHLATATAALEREAAAGDAGEPVDAGDDALRARYGVLGARETAAVRARGLREVVVPALRAMLAREPRARHAD